MKIKSILIPKLILVLLVACSSFAITTSVSAAPNQIVSGAGSACSGTDSPLCEDSQCVGDETQCANYDPNEDKCDIDKEGDCNPLKDYLNPFIKLMSALAGIAIAAGIIWGGIKYSMSEGDPQKVSAAKKHIRNSVIALLAFLFLYAFLNFLAPGLIK